MELFGLTHSFRRSLSIGPHPSFDRHVASCKLPMQRPPRLFNRRDISQLSRCHPMVVHHRTGLPWQTPHDGDPGLSIAHIFVTRLADLLSGFGGKLATPRDGSHILSMVRTVRSCEPPEVADRTNTPPAVAVPSRRCRGALSITAAPQGLGVPPLAGDWPAHQPGGLR